MLLLSIAIILALDVSCAEIPSRQDALDTMRKAATYFRTKVASHGGYVYYYSLDFSKRFGEGQASADQIWVQPPGTPAVGMSFLKAFDATGDTYYLDAAREAAEALVYGQLESGGWTNSIDFDPKGTRTALYRNGKGRGKNNSTLDDGISQHALRLLMHVDRALEFRNVAIHEASERARDALLAAQFPSGGFAQIWTGPAPKHPAVNASYPDYEWRTENRVKNYWEFLTLNDGLAGTVAAMLIDGWEIYKDERCRTALLKLGDFLILAQMPDPQPAWAQQYDFKMRPVWARKFEPPAIAGRESADAIMALLTIYQFATPDEKSREKYLEPIPRALNYLKASRLPDGRLARFYELKSNKPLYMTRDYVLTYDDSNVPEHYGWKTDSHLERIETAFKAAKTNVTPAPKGPPKPEEIRRIISALDSEGRWVTSAGRASVGNPKFAENEPIIASEVFSKHLETLSAYVRAR